MAYLNARLVLQVLGAGLILLAIGILYYQTDLRNQIPEGVAIATLVAMTGLFVIAFANSYRTYQRRNVEYVEHPSEYVEHAPVERPSRPGRRGRAQRYERPGTDVERHETIETVERRL